MRELFAGATAAEVAAPRAGDGVVPEADVVMDRGFDLETSPEDVWPWIVQLGKGRAGWYLPRTVERLLPPSRRAAREVHGRWQGLAAGDVIPDYGGADATFEVVEIARPRHLVYRSTRGHTDVSWAITLTPEKQGTRVHLRLRLGPVRRIRLAENVGGLFDALTIAGMAAGLRERLREH
jgi:Polyketide cyclase / dehydrase and lipid transport